MTAMARYPGFRPHRISLSRYARGPRVITQISSENLRRNWLTDVPCELSDDIIIEVNGRNGHELQGEIPMYLSEERSTRFYRLFFGLLRFVNERCGIINDPLYGTYEITVPETAKKVIDVLWSREGIIDEYLKEDPDDLTLLEKATVSAWRHHITSKFILYNMDEEHSIFIDGPYAFGVSGVACEISELIDRETLPAFVETTLIPYDGKIIYDTIIVQTAIRFVGNMLEMCHSEYGKAVDNGGIITEVNRFISAADEHASLPEADGGASDKTIEIPGIDKLKSELEERLHINTETFSIHDDVEMRHRISFFGDELNEIFDDEPEDTPEELPPLDELRLLQYENTVLDNLMRSYCLKDANKTSLYDVLKNQRVDELKMYAKSFGIFDISKLKKGELIEQVAGKVNSDRFIKCIVFSAHAKTKKLLAAIAKNGYAQYPASEAYDVLLECSNIAGFLCIYKDPAGYTFRAPDELLGYVRKYMTPARKRKYTLYKNLADYATAFVNLYGMVRLDDFVKIYNGQRGGSLTRDALVKNLFGLMDEGLCPDIDVYHESVVNVEATEDMEYADYLEARHKDIEMFSLPENELLNYKDPYYYEETDEAKLLYTYIIKELLPDDDETEEPAAFLADLHGCARRDVDMDGIMELIDEYGFPVKQNDHAIWIGLIYAVLNNARKWSINGWTPNELHDKIRLEQEAAKEKHLPGNVISLAQRKAAKIGRNDPCPCGSGKKYKHCCGKDL
jgi:hypothetical protein